MNLTLTISYKINDIRKWLMPCDRSLIKTQPRKSNAYSRMSFKWHMQNISCFPRFFSPSHKISGLLTFNSHQYHNNLSNLMAFPCFFNWWNSTNLRHQWHTEIRKYFQVICLLKIKYIFLSFSLLHSFILNQCQLKWIWNEYEMNII